MRAAAWDGVTLIITGVSTRVDNLSVSAVPEPALRAWLIGAASLVLAFASRARRAAATSR